MSSGRARNFTYVPAFIIDTRDGVRFAIVQPRAGPGWAGVGLVYSTSYGSPCSCCFFVSLALIAGRSGLQYFCRQADVLPVTSARAVAETVVSLLPNGGTSEVSAREQLLLPINHSEFPTNCL